MGAVGAHPVDGADPLDPDLHPDRAIAEVQEAGDLVDHLGDGRAVGVPVHGDPVTAPAAEELVDGEAGGLALDVPERGVDGRDGRHGDRTATPVAALVEVLPGVLDAGRVPAHEERADVVGEVAGDGQLAAVESRVADAGDALVRGDLEGHEVAARGGHDDLGVDDLHPLTSASASCTVAIIEPPAGSPPGPASGHDRGGAAPVPAIPWPVSAHAGSRHRGRSGAFGGACPRCPDAPAGARRSPS